MSKPKERIKVKNPRPRDYWTSDAIKTAEKIFKYAHDESETLELDMQELRFFSEYILKALYDEEDRIRNNMIDQADKQYFEHDRFME